MRGHFCKLFIVFLVTAMSCATAVSGAVAQAPASPQGQAIAPAAASSTDLTATASPTLADPGTAPSSSAMTQAAEQTVENPYSLTALWASGDFIARSTIIILAIMSMGSWYVMITKFVEQAQLLRQAQEASRSFSKAGSLRDLAEHLGKRSAFRMVAESGLNAAEHYEGNLADQIDRPNWITLQLQRPVDSINNGLQAGLSVLATVGSTAPFVGLFGTVWGIYHALTAIGIAGQASIDKVAGPVGEALIMTAIGLAVAVPAVLGYNWMVRRNKVAMDRVRNFAGDLLALLIGGGRSTPKPVALRA
ncbi:MAG TPA: MotA/TolQ/ExbB proton channel family protein [Stellaceae bacterium]|nr:MotA/TolQ/ExbB proton channel family protein [Stellaceae bacterium]